MAFAVDPTLPPMEAATAAAIPTEGGWQYEPKWDGFRCLAFRDGPALDMRSKSGQPLARYFPDVAAALMQAPGCFAVDGELVVPVDGELSFDHLQLRLHPAESRVRMLAESRPAVFILFDLLAGPDGLPLVGRPLAERRPALEAFAARLNSPRLALSPATTDPAAAGRWFESSGAALDGIVAKRLDAPYRAGERDAMVKVKRIRTADCVVGGFRYAAGRKAVGSLLLGLYGPDGLLHHVGFASGLTDRERQELTPRLEAIAGGPGFTGRAPGGPSRWNRGKAGDWVALWPRLVVEVAYDHVTGGRFRHGTRILRWRPDKAPGQCRLDQLEEGGVPLLGWTHGKGDDA